MTPPQTVENGHGLPESNLRLLHRRLAVLMAFAGLVAFAGGAGFEPVSAVLAALALVVALFWHPDRILSVRLERVWLPLAAVLVVRAAIHVLVIRDDVVIPVVDLLLLLMAAEALRSLDAPNDVRLYALSFALMLASTAYRPGILFLLAFVAYVVVSTLALMVGHLRRKAERHGVREIPLGRNLIFTTGGLAGLILIVAGVVFVTFPRVSRGWAGRGETMATSIAGFSDEVSIGEYGSRIYGNPQIVLRVEFPEGPPDDLLSLHWRGRSYDHFDGTRWTRSRGLPPSSAPARWYRERWPGPWIEQKIFAAPLDVRVLFGVHPIVGIEPQNGIQPLFDNAGDFVYWGSGAPAYVAYSRSGPPAPDSLRAARGGYAPPFRYFLQLPDRLDPRIPALADSLTAGLTNDYDKAVAIQRYLWGFRYTLELPATAGEATLPWFLFQRKAGHCEYFSTAMVVLLRAAGVEARNVNGFLGGEWSQFGNYLAVTQNQAHSWVEVWFPGYGWVTFDPTPAGAGGGERLESWFWPGRILFDAIQHRWNKWVLDYNVESQVGIFRTWSGLLRSRHERDAGKPERGRVPRTTLWAVVLLALVLVGGLWWARRGVVGTPPATRMYLRLRDACERAGVRVSPGLTPLALVERVRERNAGAARSAERVVDLYLRARFGGTELGESELREMNVALGATRRMLKARA
jgi:transglutaminase-like putative cysteine protease